METKGSFPIRSNPRKDWDSKAVMYALELIERVVIAHNIDSNTYLINSKRQADIPNARREIAFLKRECQKKDPLDLSGPGMIFQSFRRLEARIEEYSQDFFKQNEIELDALRDFCGASRPKPKEIKTHTFHRGSKKAGKVDWISFQNLFLKLENQISGLPISFRQKQISKILTRYVYIESLVKHRPSDKKMMKYAWRLLHPLVKKYDLLKEERSNAHFVYKFKRFFEGFDGSDQWP